MSMSSDIKEIALAMVKVQSLIKGAKKDTKNPFFKANYADLESVWDSCREHLTSNGLSVIQTNDTTELGDFLVTTLLHTSGQWIQGRLHVYPTKPDSQAMGSALTYSRRYALAAMIGIYQTDDDGEAAVGRGEQSFAAPVAANEYRISFGKFNGRTFPEVGHVELGSYVTYLEKKAKADNKTITGTVAEFIALATDYIVSIENQEQQPF